MEDENTMLTPTQVAARMQVSADTVKRLLRNGELVGSKVGRQWRIDQRSLHQYLQASRRNGRGA